MALFTDGSIATLADLRAYENSILDLAGAEGIDLAAKLALAQREIGLELTAFLLKNGVFPGLRRELGHVLVTEPLLHAHINTTLSLIYRDVSNSQLNDRYERKWKAYAELARQAFRQLLEVGVGVSGSPVTKAQPPVIGTVPGGLNPASTFYAQAAAMGGSGTTGERSDIVQVLALPGTLLQIQPLSLPTGGTGWMIYAGTAEESLTRQTELPLLPGEIWLAPEAGLRNDLPAIPVQTADYYARNRQQLLRG